MRIPDFLNRRDNVLFMILGLGGFLRLFMLGSQSMWIDEFCTARFASRDAGYLFWEVIAIDMHPPTFYLMEHVMARLFGLSEFSMRFLPFIFGTASIFMMYKLTRAFYSEKISLLATGLFAFNPYQIYYSQEARSYTLFLFVSLLMVYYFLMSVKYNSFLFRPFVISSVLGIYTHSYSVILLIIMNLIIFFKYREEIRLNLWIKANIVIGLFLLPIFPFYLKASLGDQYSQNTGMWLAPFYTMKDYLFGITTGLNWATIAATIISLFFMLVGLITKRDKNSKITDILFLISGLFIAIPWLISMLNKPVYSERTFILVSALILILLAVGISYMSGQGLLAFLAVTAVIYAVSLSNYFTNPQYRKIDYKQQVKYIMKNYQDNDLIVHTGVASYSGFEYYIRYYYKRGYENRQLAEIPEFTGSGTRMKVREAWRKFKEFLKMRFGVDVYAGYDKNIMPDSEVKEKIQGYRRVWLVRDNAVGMRQTWLPHGNVWYSDYVPPAAPAPGDLWWVNRYFKAGEPEKFYGTDVYLLERK